MSGDVAAAEAVHGPDMFSVIGVIHAELSASTLDEVCVPALHPMRVLNGVHRCSCLGNVLRQVRSASMGPPAILGKGLGNVASALAFAKFRQLRQLPQAIS